MPTYSGGVYYGSNFYTLDLAEMSTGAGGQVIFTPGSGNFSHFFADEAPPYGQASPSNVGIVFDYPANTASFSFVDNSGSPAVLRDMATYQLADFHTTLSGNAANYSHDINLGTGDYNDVIAFFDPVTSNYFFLGRYGYSIPLTFSPTEGAGPTSYPATSFFDPSQSNIPCFLRGTRLLTPHGERAIEDLKVGDMVVTFRTARTGHQSQHTTLQPVRWIGRRTIDLRTFYNRAAARPVRIRQGAFSDWTPSRDLLVSRDHAIYVDGVLIPAQHLVNGLTIVEDFSHDVVEYFHIELDAHSVVAAEGLLAETYLDTGNRGSLVDRPCRRAQTSPPKTWEADGCAPLLLDQNQFIPLRQRLMDRALALKAA